MARLAVLSYHTSPLAQPGTGDSGGMNVYVRELSAALARQGHDVDVYTRRERAEQRDVVRVEPGLRVHHVTAGPVRALERHEMTQHVDAFADAVKATLRSGPAPDALHANYWLSGVAGHRLKHELDIPLLVTFHTLERVKASTFEGESEERAEQETALLACADAALASCDVEADQLVRLYGASAKRVRVVPLGVEHAFFAPGRREQARRAIGANPDVPLLLFVGRVQELKGVNLALETLIELRERGVPAELAMVGGPSGPHGREVLEGLHQRAIEAGVIEAVTFVAPQAHQLLSTWLRAGDVTLVPSRAESFGLVALESSACATPVVASDVGGLPTLVDDDVNGYLLESREPGDWADAVQRVLQGPTAARLGAAGAERARAYTWRAAAESLGSLVCSLAEPADATV